MQTIQCWILTCSMLGWSTFPGVITTPVPRMPNKGWETAEREEYLPATNEQYFPGSTYPYSVAPPFIGLEGYTREHMVGNPYLDSQPHNLQPSQSSSTYFAQSLEALFQPNVFQYQPAMNHQAQTDTQLENAFGGSTSNLAYTSPMPPRTDAVSSVVPTRQPGIRSIISPQCHFDQLINEVLEVIKHRVIHLFTERYPKANEVGLHFVFHPTYKCLIGVNWPLDSHGALLGPARVRSAYNQMMDVIDQYPLGTGSHWEKKRAIFKRSVLANIIGNPILMPIIGAFQFPELATKSTVAFNDPFQMKLLKCLVIDNDEDRKVKMKQLFEQFLEPPILQVKRYSVQEY